MSSHEGTEKRYNLENENAFKFQSIFRISNRKGRITTYSTTSGLHLSLVFVLVLTFTRTYSVLHGEKSYRSLQNDGKNKHTKKFFKRVLIQLRRYNGGNIKELVRLIPLDSIH